MKRLPLLLAGALLTTGCGIMGIGGDDEGPEPAALTDITTTVQVTRLWTASCGSGDDVGIKLAVASDGDVVYCANQEGGVSAFSLADGKRLWESDLDLPITGGPGAGAGRVVVGTATAELVALDATDGSEIWRTRVSSQVLSAPAVNRSVAVVQSADGRLSAHDVTNGQRLWYYDSSVPALSLRGTSPPLIVGDRVLAGFANGKLAAFTARDGRQQWETAIAIPRGRSELDRMVDIDAAPVVANNTVFAVNYQGRVAAVSLRSGAMMWARDMSSSSGLGVAGGRVFVSDATSHLWGLDDNGGASYWRQEALERRRLTAPVVLDRHVAVGDYEGYLHFFDVADGNEVARLRVGDGPMLTPPLVVDGTLVTLDANGALVAVRLGS